MTNLWFYEQRNMRGIWIPCTQENQPTTAVINGETRLKLADGSQGSVVRNVRLIPQEYHSTSLESLQCIFGDACI